MSYNIIAIMKKYFILLIFLILQIASKAQTYKLINYFLDIRFDSTPGQVINALKAKGITEDTGYNNTYSQTNTLRFNNVLYGGRKCAEFNVLFVKDRAFQAEFIFEPDSTTNINEYYHALIKKISDAYGHVYTRSDNTQTMWNDISNNMIWCYISSKQIMLIYRDTKLFALSQSRQNQ